MADAVVSEDRDAETVAVVEEFMAATKAAADDQGPTDEDVARRGEP